jgi:hypothetical protein
MTSSKNVEASPAFGSHQDIVDRIKKSLYYGRTKKPNEVMDYPSLPLTEATVDLFEKAIKNKCIINTTGSISKGLSILDVNYMSSISDKGCLSPCSVVVALIYMERLKKRNPDYLKTASPTDLFLISMLIASKYLFDDGEEEQVFNNEWSEFAAMDLIDFNRLEIQFLLNIDWDIHVKPKEFYDKLQLIETLVTWKQTTLRNKTGKNNGYTYQELLSLEKCLSWKVITDQVLKTIALTFMTYSAVLVTVFATTVLLCSIHSVMIHGQHDMRSKELDIRLNPQLEAAGLNHSTCGKRPIVSNGITQTTLSYCKSRHLKNERNQDYKPRLGSCQLEIQRNYHDTRKGTIPLPSAS